MTKLNDREIHQRMKQLESNWVLKGKFIQREIMFSNFVEAFSFMTSVALVAEKIDHHPNWENSYNKVTIALSTHDSDGITEKDFSLAKEIDVIIKKYVQQHT
ncbi:MAG: 4a-hydroxytetrahydrobiopterin dehydratase [Bacteroidales bacterium]